MASPTTPTHGKFGIIYWLRPNGFKGSGLNDATWGTGYSAADSAYFEVVIDGVGTGGGGADTFKWRKDGGEWTETVDITGAAQTLSDSQTITFSATTGHTAADQWVIGNLKDEACDESGTTGQITDTAMRILNPNAPPTFTDSGGETVQIINYTNGTGTFTGNVTEVTVTGNNGYIPATALEKVGYLYEWQFTATLDLAQAPRMQQKWMEHVVGMAGGSGSAGGYFLSSKSFTDALITKVTNSETYQLLQLFNYDPDDDQTGDHFTVWAILSGAGTDAPVGDVVKETINFQLHGLTSFTANA